VVEFACMNLFYLVHLLNELESKHDAWVRARDQMGRLSVDFDKLLG
jgi:hypothetical protein